MKKKGFLTQLVSGLLVAVATLSLAGCGDILYRQPAYNYSGRPIPPSGLLQRVLAAYTANGSAGGLEIIDGLRDTRSNIQDTIPAYFIKGFSEGNPTQIISFPEQLTGYVFSNVDGSVSRVDYSTEAGAGTAGSFGASSPSVAVAPSGQRIAGAVPNSGVISLITPTGSYSLNLPNVNKVVINQGNSIILAMVRNSNALYRVVQLPATSNPVLPSVYVDCEPLILPVYCVVPVNNPATASAFDRPVNAYFALDGSSVYILNCGPECGGKTAGITFLDPGSLNVNITTIAPTSVQTLPGGVANPVPVPGGVTTALSDGVTLYLAGQQLQSNGLFAGNLSTMTLSNNKVTAKYSISDGSHSRLLFADDNTLWIGSQQCANGPRALLASQQVAAGIDTTQAANYNCLTRFVTSSIAAITSFSVSANVATFNAPNSFAAGESITVSGLTAGSALNGQTYTVLTAGLSASQFSVAVNNANVATTTDAGTAAVAEIVPVVSQSATNPVIVPFPNTNQNQYYYGDLNGICWVQQYHKVYTAYGGQLHAFDTQNEGLEIDNRYFTVQGTVLDVAYMDALTNSAN